jgi:hypothetical protein
MALDRDELIEHLEEQRAFLVSSCDAFDAGHRYEAKRIASAVRTLVHHTRRSHALLVQLEVRDEHDWPCVNDAGVPEQTIFSTGRMLSMELSPAGLSYSADLTLSGREVPFSEWWNEAIFKSPVLTFTRRSVMGALSNQGGGSHVDPAPDNPYRTIAEGDAVGWTVITVDEDGPTQTVEGKAVDGNNPLPQLQRAIAVEVVSFIDRVLER